MPAPPQATTLYTIAMSHYSEKIRWLLDVEQIPYEEVALTPVFHVPTALFKGRRGRTTMPLLQAGRHGIQDSTRIVEWLARERGPLRTLPAAALNEVMAVEDRFDAIGQEVARCLYFTGFEHTTTVIDLWTRFATPWQARTVRWAYPLIKAVFKLKLRIHAAAAARAERRIDEAMHWLEARLAAGHTHLVGDAFTVADITAASLLAPMACPLEHPVYGTAAYRATLAPRQARWRDRAALDWVRQMYARHRGPVWATPPRAARRVLARGPEEGKQARPIARDPDN